MNNDQPTSAPATCTPTPSCTCDSPLCEASWICKQLGELRIAWRILDGLRKVPEYGIETLEDAINHIETECEILCH